MRYVVMDEAREYISGDIWTEEHEDLLDAVQDAEYRWNHKTPSERKENTISVLLSIDPDEEAPDHFDGWPVWRDGEEQLLSIREIRNITKLSQAKFSKLYGIPQRTLESWEMGERNPPEYVLSLLQRVVMMDMEGR